MSHKERRAKWDSFATTRLTLGSRRIGNAKWCVGSSSCSWYTRKSFSQVRTSTRELPPSCHTYGALVTKDIEGAGAGEFAVLSGLNVSIPGLKPSNEVPGDANSKSLFQAFWCTCTQIFPHPKSRIRGKTHPVTCSLWEVGRERGGQTTRETDVIGEFSRKLPHCFACTYQKRPRWSRSDNCSKSQDPEMRTSETNHDITRDEQYLRHASIHS